MYESFLIHQILSIETANTKYGKKFVAEIAFLDRPKIKFWLSPKQGENLKKIQSALEWKNGFSTKSCEGHIVVEKTDNGYRYVWGGIHKKTKSDLPFLEERYNIKIHSPYIG